jgi:hypothetical protein
MISITAEHIHTLWIHLNARSKVEMRLLLQPDIPMSLRTGLLDI